MPPAAEVLKWTRQRAGAPATSVLIHRFVAVSGWAGTMLSGAGPGAIEADTWPDPAPGLRTSLSRIWTPSPAPMSRALLASVTLEPDQPTTEMPYGPLLAPLLVS